MTVTLTAERVDSVVRLSVADRGPGLAEEDTARVFDRFLRAGGGPGSDLGMAIVRKAVEDTGHGSRDRTAPAQPRSHSPGVPR